jgi:hypothetical protein
MTPSCFTVIGLNNNHTIDTPQISFVFMCYSNLRRGQVWNHKCEPADLMDNVSVFEFSIIRDFFGLLVLTVLEKSCVFVKSTPYRRDTLRNGPHNDLLSASWG